METHGTGGGRGRSGRLAAACPWSAVQDGRLQGNTAGGDPLCLRGAPGASSSPPSRLGQRRCDPALCWHARTQDARWALAPRAKWPAASGGFSASLPATEAAVSVCVRVLGQLDDRHTTPHTHPLCRTALAPPQPYSQR